MKQYQPLYLKYRPQKLSEVIGQEVVTKTLSNAISYNKIVHAYLFCGPRGTGKTSTARILAKSLNCQGGITLEPCGECVSCRSIMNGNSLDVIEIDAASHRKVEDAEDLINRVNLGTYGSRFKVYIIDEVHMLTDHAFNALLKTLEEPPKNVIFILATTEEYKVIPTIISRCQKLDFKPVPEIQIEEKIKNIAKQEKINIDQSIISFISKRSQGCLRDAVSLLDQISVLQIEDKSIDPQEVFELFGTVDRTVLFKLMETVLKFEKKTAIDLAEDLVKSGKDISELLKSLLELIIDLGKAKLDSNYKKTLTTELKDDLKILDNIEQKHILKIIDRLQYSQSKLRFALSQDLQFMVEIMSMLDEDFLVSMAELKERIEKLELSPRAHEPISLQISEPINLTTPESLNYQTTEPLHLKTSVSLPDDLDSTWKKAVSLIESNPTKTLLTQSDSYLIKLTNDIVEIGISKDMFLPRLEQDTKKKEMILKAIKLSSNTEPKTIKFRVQPRPKIKEEIETNNHESQFEENDLKTDVPNKEKRVTQSGENEDEFTRTIKDLLGAKQID